MGNLAIALISGAAGSLVTIWIQLYLERLRHKETAALEVCLGSRLHVVPLRTCS
jgi:hypothetical protein